MTKEKAIQVLNTYYRGEDNNDREFCNAIDMAIKALEQQPSNDCERVLNRVMEYTYGMLTTEKIGLQHLIKSMIDDLPPVTPTRKVGKWIPIDKENNIWKCSNCIELGKDDWWKLNSGTPQDNKMDYCPHCGAEMRGE